MKYLSIFQYAYLAFAAVFFYSVFETYQKTGVVNYSYIVLGALAIFMFFFRRKFSKKFQDRNKQN
ncbi:hypothetical protein FUA26_13755 [Seonamhaeicola algicola]|uniref:Uncharacterized protein n=1 Tax=Seonamhaeicola algicola TaxID=1719036 RepID=A0A5C7AFF4_9FLAO|nr:hypothetical protein [Seonamhaeicola algicola]TXE07278.1 hypothetical protein FUA26_13755 [Seonamhaeicola algicola]